MKLHDIKDNDGARPARMRVGRGIGSGKGKQSGRGGKGQTARSGVRIKGFEGGQMPLHRRLPKRGFNPPFPTKTAEVNVGSLEVFGAGAKVDERALRDRGLVKGACDQIKILGEGEITKAVIVTAHAFSKGAAAKIEKAGGKALLVNGSQAVHFGAQ